MIDKFDSIAVKVEKWMGGILASVAACILVLWILVMMLSIIARASFGISWLFIEEYTAYFNLLAASGGFAYAAYKGQHIVVRVLISRMSGRARLVLECLTTALSIWFIVFVSLKISRWLSTSMKTGASSLQTDSPLWVPILVLAVGLFSFLLALLIHLFHTAVLAYHGREETSQDGVAG